MKRRNFIAAFATPVLPQTPRNRMAEQANAFIAAWGEWARAVNAMQPGTLSMDEDKAFQPLEKMFQRVVKARREWLT